MSQVDMIYALLVEKPRTVKEFEEHGIFPYELRARITDLRNKIRRRGMDVLNRDGIYELVKPQ